MGGTYHVVTPRFIEAAHRAGLGVQVWTVNEPADARRLLGWGVDALITDRPDLMVPLVSPDETSVTYGATELAKLDFTQVAGDDQTVRLKPDIRPQAAM